MQGTNKVNKNCQSEFTSETPEIYWCIKDKRKVCIEFLFWVAIKPGENVWDNYLRTLKSKWSWKDWVIGPEYVVPPNWQWIYLFFSLVSISQYCRLPETWVSTSAQMEIAPGEFIRFRTEECERDSFRCLQWQLLQKCSNEQGLKVSKWLHGDRWLLDSMISTL